MPTQSVVPIQSIVLSFSTNESCFPIAATECCGLMNARMDAIVRAPKGKL